MKARLALMAIVVGGCSVAGTRSPPAEGSPQASSAFLSSGPSGSAAVRRPLPSGFPIMPRAAPVPMPRDDPGLIGTWESDQAGSAAYDFYVEALPAAGYPIVGRYPGGEVAVIRFEVADGEVWQMVAHPTPEGGVAIEIRLDRP
ncbi:MAG: hypothetical protein ABI458_00870 [Chloroflexota bacterium]